MNLYLGILPAGTQMSDQSSYVPLLNCPLSNPPGLYISVPLLPTLCNVLSPDMRTLYLAEENNHHNTWCCPECYEVPLDCEDESIWFNLLQAYLCLRKSLPFPTHTHTHWTHSRPSRWHVTCGMWHICSKASRDCDVHPAPPPPKPKCIRNL